MGPVQHAAIEPFVDASSAVLVELPRLCPQCTRVFALLSFLLTQSGWQNLFNLSKEASLPVPLIATLAMTTLLPSIPILKRVDSWLLSNFLNWGAIPAEARWLTEKMVSAPFTVISVDVEALRGNYEGGYGETFTEHLREEGASGLKRSEYRFTRVVKLYDRIHRLAAEPRYRRFFAETRDEFAALERQIDSFMRRAVAGLDGVGRPSVVEGNAAFQELISEWHGRFADDCREHFVQLARFLARAVLRSEPGKAELVVRLREIGFTAIGSENTPEFPLNSLTVLGLGIFAYLVVLTIWFSYISHPASSVLPQDPSGLQSDLVLAGKITLARIIPIGMTVWLLQQFAFFRRKTGDQPRYFAYFVNGILAALVAAGVCAVFRIGDALLFTKEAVGDAARIGIMSGILCTAVALCCDDWSEDSSPPAWLRSAEAIGCGFAMAAGAALLWFAGMGPPISSEPTVSPELLLATWIGFPGTMATMIGACVPHIYRASRRAAAAHLASTTQTAALLQEPRLVPTQDTSPQHFDKAA